ncbi:hypothetical protein C7401_10127 [Paraburkholderia unamae]|nr:hypothetical protein C7401_10127 [Paraburkholderia unamae]
MTIRGVVPASEAPEKWLDAYASGRETDADQRIANPRRAANPVAPKRVIAGASLPGIPDWLAMEWLNRRAESPDVWRWFPRTLSRPARLGFPTLRPWCRWGP